MAAKSTVEGAVSRLLPGDPGLAPFGGHPGPVHAVAVTPDGAEVVTGGTDGNAHIWDRRTGATRKTLTGHTGLVSAVAVTPDGAEVVTGSNDGSARIWDRRSGELRATLTGHTGSALAVAVTPDGAEVVTGGSDGHVRIWDRRNGELRKSFAGHTGSIWAVAVTPDGTEVVTGSNDGSVNIWDPRSGQLRATLTGHTGSALAVAVTPDGAEVVTGGSDGHVRIWDRRNGELRKSFAGHTGSIWAVAVTPDGTEVVTGGGDGDVNIWDRRSGDPHVTLTSYAGYVRARVVVHALVVTPDGAEVVTAGGDGILRIWDRRSRELEMILAGHTGSVRAVAVTPDGAEVVTGGTDGSARIWDRRSGELRKSLAGHTGSTLAVAVTPDGAEVLTAGEDGNVRIWDRRSGKLRDTLTGHGGYVLAVAVTPDGAEVVTGGGDGTLRIWDRRSGKLRISLAGHSGFVWAVAVTPDGAEVLTAGEDGDVRIWDWRSGELRVILTYHADSALAVAVTPDGTEVISTGRDGDVRISDRSSRRLRTSLTGHTGYVWAVAVTPDGTEVITGSDDGTARIWNRRSGKHRATLTGHTGYVWAVAVTPDGTEVITGSEDGTIRVWNRRSARQTAGTDLPTVALSHVLPGLHSDEPSDADLLGVGGDVETLARLIMAASTEAPLSIGIMGEWGSGKSSLMRQMEREIASIATLSAANIGQSDFVGSIRQVRFNAWHYSDDLVWPGLVDHLFAELSATPQLGDGAHRNSQSQARERRARIEAELHAAEAASRRPGVALDRAAKARNRPFGSIAEMVVLARALGSDVLRELRRSWRWMLPLVLVVATAVLLYAFLGPYFAALAPLIALATGAARWLRQTQRSGTGLIDGATLLLQRRQDRAEQEIQRLKDELAVASATERLRRFLEEDRRVADTYAPYRGLLAEVHRDLRTLHDHLVSARREWLSEDERNSPAPVDRIVLYVDDLDRCPPKRVVEVLAAVHLLLALPLFVVVVAIDPRWLVSSLRRHFGDLFTGVEANADSSTATALDYLDKIFQIPYALRPMGAGAGAYLQALLPEEESVDVKESEPVMAGDVQGSPEGGALDGQAGPERHATVPDERHETEELERLRLLGDSGSRRVVLDLHPESLRLRSPERAFVPLLGPLLSTPRGAKKLTNLYRLVRISLPEDELDTFVGDDGGGPYQAVLLLLAVLVGHPVLARELLVALPTSTHVSFFDLVKELADRDGGDQRWRRLDAALEQVRKQAEDKVTAELSIYRQWASAIARFSFHTQDLLGDLDRHGLDLRQS